MNQANKDLWDAKLYDGRHTFVSQYGQDLVELLAPKKGEDILDLGCGTGDLTKMLQDLGVYVQGIDFSVNMIDRAKAKYPDVTFAVADAVNLPFNSIFDAVFSNATLHWIKTPEQALQSIHKSLKRGGKFVAEFGAKGNVAQITGAVQKQFYRLGLTYPDERFPWFFPSIGEYTQLLEQVGFHVRFARQFSRPTPLDGSDGLRNWLAMFGKSMFSGLSDETVHTLIVNIEDDLRQILYQDDHWIADYERLQVIAQKS